MIHILLFIKQKIPQIWQLIEKLNGMVFTFLFEKRFHRIVQDRIERSSKSDFEFFLISDRDVEGLYKFLSRQPESQRRFFNPHGFELETVSRLQRNPSFIMMGVRFEDVWVGYFFLRCFINKRCFIGRLVDLEYQRRGIARLMSEIMYESIWAMGFRCLTTISKSNSAISALHEVEGNCRILKELPNDYLLVEILPA